MNTAETYSAKKDRLNLGGRASSHVRDFNPVGDVIGIAEFSLVGPGEEAGMDLGSCPPASPGCSRLCAVDVVLWLLARAVRQVLLSHAV